MARGRMLNRKISTDRKVGKLYDAVGGDGCTVYTWIIAHLDRDGRCIGDPEMLKWTVVPRLKGVTVELIEKTLAEAHRLGLLIWYEVDDDLWVQYPAFQKNQVGMRYDREAESDCPPPPVLDELQESSSPELVRSRAGVEPELVRTSAGVVPDQLPQNGMEWNGNERKEAAPETEPEREPDTGEPVSSFLPSFSSLGEIAESDALSSVLENQPSDDSIKTKGELFDRCAQGGIQGGLGVKGEATWSELVNEAWLTETEIAYGISCALRLNKRSVGFVLGCVRQMRIDAKDGKRKTKQATTPEEMPPQPPGNGASRDASPPPFVAPPELTPEERDASLQGLQQAKQELEKVWESRD